MGAENKPSYYAILPANVRYDNRLKANEKIMYAEITALSESTGKCWASNNYFAELYEVTPQAISKWVKNIEKLGYINTSYIYKEGTKMIERRYISIVQTNVSKVSTDVEGGINHSLGGYQQTIKGNTTSNNTTSNNKDIVEQSSTTYPFSEIISYLNLKADTKYRASSRKTQTLIKARYNEGFTLEDFKTVIDKKTAEWKSDNKMSAYLRPETLFGTKFESYLNQKTVQPSFESGAKVIKKEHDEKPPEIEMSDEEREAMIERIRQGLDFL